MRPRLSGGCSAKGGQSCGIWRLRLTVLMGRPESVDVWEIPAASSG